MDATSTGKIGKYSIIRVLGRGGMGEVILAQDEDLGRRVAIKRPFKSAMEEGLARFQVEAKAATLRHPNIPAVYEMGMQDGLPFIAMEYVEGEPLDKMIAEGRPTDLISKLSIIEQVCLALGHAHEKGIIHRDIKPANVIVQPDGVAKIIDFGIAKIQNLEMTSGLTQTSQIIGSLHYIAPERFKGEGVDGRADIFSTGVMLYLLLTGHLPFGGGEATASYKIVNESHTALGKHLHDYPAALDGILDRALAKSPYDRYATAEDFADGLHEVIEDLKRTRVQVLFDDAERLTTESRYAPALELLDEAIKLDPANTQVRKLRKLVREHQERLKRAERVREYTTQADTALRGENFTEALTALREAQRLDPNIVDLKQRIDAIEEQKRRFEKSMSALAEAETARSRGDINGALKIVERTLPDDPENTRLLAARAVMIRQRETEAQHGRLFQLVELARQQLDSRQISGAEKLLGEAEALDPSHPRVDELRHEILRCKEHEERKSLLEEVQRRVGDFLRADNFEAAADLLNRAIAKLPSETVLLRLKADVEAQARKFDSIHIVDSTLARARELFTQSPDEAIALVQKAIEELPGEERLIACERKLRQEADSQRNAKIHHDALQNARELMDGRNFEKAISVLEAVQLECGSTEDIDQLLTYAKQQVTDKNRRATVERCMAEAKALVQGDRLEDAIRTLEVGIQATGDASLTRMLDETREKQMASARKMDLLHKRVALLRDRSELDEAVQLLQAELNANPSSAAVDGLLKSVLADREQKTVSNQAIATAHAAAQRRDYACGLDALQTVIQAYGESVELTREVRRLQGERAAFAQEVVDHSIENARAALLRHQPELALAALKETAAWVEFVDERRQADWQRIAKTAKDELKKTPSISPQVPQAQSVMDKGGTPRKGSGIVWLLVVLLVLGVSGAALWWKFKPFPLTPVVSEAHIVIAKAPPGSKLAVDGYPPVIADAQGEATVVVKPGEYKLVVSKDGFAPFNDDVTIGAGETYRDAAQLSLLPPAGQSGTLAVKGNVPKVKVFVDDVYKGLVTDGAPIQLEVGTHTVRYSAPGYVDSSSKTIAITLNGETTDSFNLTAIPSPASNVGNLIVTANPGAHISIDGGKYSGTANNNGTLQLNGLTPGRHLLTASLDGFTTIQGKQVEVAAGQNGAANAQMIAISPVVEFFRADQSSIESGQSVSLSWKVDNAASVVIEPIGSVPSSGIRSVSPDETTAYRLSANGGAAQQSLTVTVRAKARNGEQTSQVNQQTQSSTGTDPDALRFAVNSYKTVFVLASGKSSHDCKNVFNNSYGGLLKGLADWCDLANRFQASEKCTEAPGGTDQSPTFSCVETITALTKEGDKKVFPATRKTFHFVRNSDGTWKVSRWE